LERINMAKYSQKTAYRVWSCPKCAATFKIERSAYGKNSAEASARASQAITEIKIKHKKLGCENHSPGCSTSFVCLFLAFVLPPLLYHIL